MTERYVDLCDFDGEAVSATLGADSRTTRDVAHGDGETLLLADGNAELEVYPTAAVARVTTPDARVELFRIPSYTVDPEAGHIVFEQGAEDTKTRLVVSSDGTVFFGLVLQAPERATTNETTTDDAEVRLAPRGASERATASPEGSTTPTVIPEGAEAEPVQLRGRLGRDPWFTGGEESEVIGGFPLAVNAERRGGTTWHKVVTFGETAELLREAHRTGQIRRGRLVDVTGQHVVREEESARRGRPLKIHEFHATSVTRVTATKTPKPQS